MTVERIRGVIAPLLTPFNDDYSIATDLYVAHAKRLLAQGCAGITPFGTTGEALSVSIDERIAAIRALIDAGIDPSRMIPGTGLSNVADSARLSRACLEMGCAGVMTLPPFYFKGVTDDGLYRYFEQLIAAIGSIARIYLYHIPPVAVVGISPLLAARLRTAYPEQVVGIKDSSGDWENTKALLKIDDFIVYPGSEVSLLEALELGAAGCITATANVNAKSIVKIIELYDHGDLAAARALHEAAKAVRLKIQSYGPIPAQKQLLAISTGDVRWCNVRPPLSAMASEQGRELAATLKHEFAFGVVAS